MTTSLSAYLVENGFCDLLVDGIKEPSVFSSDPELAAAILQRNVEASRTQWLLDASVNYVHSNLAIDSISSLVENRKIIVCVRNQLRRTVSAYRLYRGRYTLPSNVEWLHDPVANFTKYGDGLVRARLALDSLAPAYISRSPIGRYGYTNIWANETGMASDDPRIAECDAQLALLDKQSLPERIVFELRYLQRNKCFPPASILVNSYFFEPLKRAFQHFERSCVWVTSPGQLAHRGELANSVRKFLGTGHTSGDARFPHVHEADRWGVAVSARDLQLAEEILRPSLLQDTENLRELLGRTDELDLYSATG